MVDKDRPARMENVVDLEVPVAVVLAERSVPLAEILELRPGAVLELGRRHDDPLPLLVNGARVGSGKAVDIGERLGFLLETVDSAAAAGPNLS
jgi:flagellar motor switch/type III secretory pathway protein FliN